ncbi:MAG: UDP binding domain-containing protein, partial [Casimicrobiaceae bacterium]
DLRNSRVIDVIRELESYGATIHVFDPVANAADALHEYGIRLTAWDDLPRAAAIVAAVAHRETRGKPPADFLGKLQPNGVIIDVKSQFAADAFNGHPVTVWRL